MTKQEKEAEIERKREERKAVLEERRRKRREVLLRKKKMELKKVRLDIFLRALCYLRGHVTGQSFYD